ncbi:MAG: hypothetical protein GQ578_08160 [Desulfuromonadaceae bacterium]|nr:hypothetical protein [Desulfuromonadaceae bacterium]
MPNLFRDKVLLLTFGDSVERQLIEKLLQDEQVEKRLQAVRELAGLKVFPWELFLRGLADEDWRVRKESVTIYLQLPDAASRARLILEQLAHPENAGLRNAAIELLIGLGSQIVPVLLEALSASTSEIRKFIVDILGEVDSCDAVPQLLPLLHDPDQNVCYAAVETFGKLKAVAAVPALLDCLDESDTGLRFAIFETLAAIAENVPVERILPYAEDNLLRKPVYLCLGQLGNPAAIPILMNGLADPLRKTREVALLSMGRLVQSLPLDRLPEPEVDSTATVEQLVKYLESEDLKLRRAACYSLSLFAEPGIVKQLLPLLAEEDLRSDVVNAAKRVPQKALCCLAKSVDLQDKETLYLIFLLGELGCVEVADLAISGLQSEDPQVRFASAQALGKIAAVKAVRPLGDALADPIPEIREVVTESLRQIGRRDGDAMLKTILPYLDSPDAALRVLAVKSLGALSSNSSVEGYLLQACKDAVPEVRCEVLRSLSGHQSQRLLSGLSLALTDEVADVRRLATSALAAFPLQKSSPILEHALIDSDPWVRMAAIRALTPGDAEIIHRFIEHALNDSVGLVVIAALETAHRLLPAEASGYLHHMLTHEDHEVVATAVRLLLQAAEEEQLIAHERVQVRKTVVIELQQYPSERWQHLFQYRLVEEAENSIRQLLQEALKKRALGA